MRRRLAAEHAGISGLPDILGTGCLYKGELRQDWEAQREQILRSIEATTIAPIRGVATLGDMQRITLNATAVGGIAPALIITAENDVLGDEGENSAVCSRR